MNMPREEDNRTPEERRAEEAEGQLRYVTALSRLYGGSQAHSTGRHELANFAVASTFREADQPAMQYLGEVYEAAGGSLHAAAIYGNIDPNIQASLLRLNYKQLALLSMPEDALPEHLPGDEYVSTGIRSANGADTFRRLSGDFKANSLSHLVLEYEPIAIQRRREQSTEAINSVYAPVERAPAE